MTQAMKHLFTIIILAAALLASCSNPQVSSPDGRVTLSLTTDSAGQIYYQVDVDDSTFIAPSRLGAALIVRLGMAPALGRKQGNP